jgi:uncharacterized protein YegJ (DUF2314 family)
MRPLSLFLLFLCCTSGFAQKWQGKEPGNETGPVNGEAYQKAIAPYVAKARATYPGAKKRFLAGLPPKHTFYVWTRLYQEAAKGQRPRVEDVFIQVHTITDGKVYGIIANTPDLVTNYKQGQRVQFPELEVLNWVIVRPDGSEEGNYVGKFLEKHYKVR